MQGHAGQGKAKDPETHLDLKRGVGQELQQAVAATLITVPHPHLVLPCGPLGPCGQGRVCRPHQCPLRPTQPSQGNQCKPETWAGTSTRTWPGAGSSYAEGGVLSPSLSPKDWT